MDAILTQIGTTQNVIANIENQLFEVVTKALPSPAIGFDAPEVFGTYKSNGGKCLGVVGSSFAPTQPATAWEKFIEAVMACEYADVDKVEYNEMRGGEKIRFSVPIGKISFINLKGLQDESIVRLNVQTGYDGKTKTSMYLTTYRMICKNGMKASVTEFACSFKNTHGNKNKGKVNSLLADVMKQIRNFENLTDAYQAMNKKEVTKEQIDAYVQTVTGFDFEKMNDTTNARVYGANAKTREIVANIYESIELEISRTGQTAFGLLNGITHYTNHVAKGSENEEYIFLDSGATLNDKALAVAMQLIEA